jgi:probable addiction module antidote protein
VTGRRAIGLETTRWDAADHLVSPEAILAYLEAVFEDGDTGLIAVALDDVVRARNLRKLRGPSP